MTKTTSIILLCIVTVLVLFLGVFSFIPDLEYGDYNLYHSPFDLIQKSVAFTDSLKATYQVKFDEGTDSFDGIEKVLSRQKYGLPAAYAV